MIGISCTAFSSESPEKWLDSIVGRFDLWEIFSEADHSITDNYKEISKLLPSYDLSYSIHSPISDINVASIVDSVRKASVKEIVDTIKAANKLGIDRVTVHPGLSSMSVRGMESRYVAKAKESMEVFDEAAKEYGIDVAIENMPEAYFFLGRTAEELSEIVEGTDLRICFDIGHANTTSQIDEMVSTFKGRIVNVHIHDNDGSKDAHSTLGEGNIDFARVIRSLKGYDGNYVIEARSMESALESQSFLKKLF